MRSKILGLFGNTLTVGHMNSPYNTDKLQQQLETALSAKPKTFSEFFFPFLKSK